jgi:hypothetical protein
MRSIARFVFPAALLCSFSFQTNDCVNIPAENKKVVAYVKSKIGKKVGEYCNDFIEGGYKAAEAYWGGTPYGPTVDYTKECIYPGDLIALGHLEMSWKRNDSLVGLVFDKELEYFIYKVKAKGRYMVARTETVGDHHKVLLTEIDINNCKKGKPKIYRLKKQ